TLTVRGVDDYCCMPHEAVGMVGRIVVGQPLGPGAEPFDYWVGRPGTDSWHHVPDAARQSFPSIAQILHERRVHPAGPRRDRKSTRLNSSHEWISYAVFCLKKKKKKKIKI